MPSFSIALTGLQADSVALSTIGNNLANLNTTAFKKQTVNFADMFYQNLGSSGSNAPLQMGIGTRIASIESNFSQGNLSTTGSATDMAINGSGFFVVKQAGTQQLTRTGNFQLSSSGDLITSEGYGVQGYPTDNGSINLNGSLKTLNVPISKTQLASPTTSFALTASLDSTTAVGGTFTASAGMYDSLGQQHNVSIEFTKASTNQWSYDISLPAGEASASSGTTGTLTFNPDGTLASPIGTVSGIKFNGLADDANDLNLSWQVSDASGNSLLTQASSKSTQNASSQNGYASGTFKSFSVDSTGILTATYTNGGTETVGQIAVATVANPSALHREGSNLYSVDSASGTMDVGVASTGGRGSIAGNALEQSNVDISTEFADLIVAQRSFEANSKTVTAFDTITQDTINMIR